MLDFELVIARYHDFQGRVARARELLKRPLTLTEKILYAHLSDGNPEGAYIRGRDYVNLAPDRVAMQDATAQMAILQFMHAGRASTAVPTTIHCDHLITAREAAEADLRRALDENREVFDFLKAAAAKYTMGFWEPGSGIIHQIVFENYAFPGGLMIGTDSHTPNAGGLGMLGIGVGGADAVDVMAGLPWELKMPEIIGVELTGQLNGWTSAKDVILKLAGILGVKGGTDAIIEYFGDGAARISCTGKGTICNMGAELGATASVFPYDTRMMEYLIITGREEIAAAAAEIRDCLVADPEVYQKPEACFDRVIRIDLDTLEPHINGPFTPDRAVPLSKFSAWIATQEYPVKLAAGLVGSCTNSSYQDMARAASIARQANWHNIRPKAELLVNPGTARVRKVSEDAGFIPELRALGARILANACGPCIGQWDRNLADPTAVNSIITSFNRNFAKRNDGNPNTCAFVASPEIVTAMAIAGDLRFNPLYDSLPGENGEAYRFQPPSGAELPPGVLTADLSGFHKTSDPQRQIRINAHSERLQLLESFPAWSGQNYRDLFLLMKVKGKCTTDHISPAGPWLKYRGHLDRISDNLLTGAENAFTGSTGIVLNRYTGEQDRVAAVARAYKAQQQQSVIIADENYGEGSSREHAAMEPRYLGVAAVIVKSFARIHETNLKKQGVLALTFTNPADYDRIGETDNIDITGLESFTPGRPLRLVLKHQSGTTESIEVVHTYNDRQIEWFVAGSAMNFLRAEEGSKHE